MSTISCCLLEGEEGGDLQGNLHNANDAYVLICATGTKHKTDRLGGVEVTYVFYYTEINQSDCSIVGSIFSMKYWTR